MNGAFICSVFYCNYFQLYYICSKTKQVGSVLSRKIWFLLAIIIQMRVPQTEIVDILFGIK